MSDGAAFLEAILADPADDVLRLVYADWLEEHGDPDRAEFIRVQCQLAKEERGSGRAQLEARAQDLLRAHEAEWAAPLRPLVHEWDYERGFIGTITVQLRGFLNHAEELFSLAPIQVVRLRTYGAGKGEEEDEEPALLMPQLAACPYLARLSEVDLSWLSLGEAGFRDFLASEYLKEVRTLVFADSDAFPETARLLADCPNVPRLSGLYFTGDYYGFLGDEGLAILASSRHLSGLTSLGIGPSEIGDAGVQALAASPAFANLTFLDLRSNQIGPDGLRALAGSAHLRRLDTLSLSSNEVGDEGLEALAASPNLRSVTRLDVRENGISERGVVALASSPNAAGLSWLWLDDKAIGDAGVQAVASSPHLAGLTDLRLSGYSVGPAGLRALVESPYLANIEKLVVSPLRPEGRETLRARFGDRLLKG